MRIKALGFALLLGLLWPVIHGQDYDGGVISETPATPALPEQNRCNGIFVTYAFVSREKEFPRLKNISAQPWAFKAEASVLNAGDDELRAWKVFVGFQHREILVSADGAVVIPADDGGSGGYGAGVGEFPVEVGNGTYLSGSDLKTAIDTAGDLDQIEAQVSITGTMFGLKAGAIPMPKTLRLENDGYDCPSPRIHGKSAMYVCCTANPKFKAKKAKATKFSPRQNGDLSISYDILQAYSENYLAQVTLDNNHALGRLDHWNLTWEWTRGEFINTMRGAYTHKHDASPCIYGPAGMYYTGLDFSQVMSCEKRPIISDLPEDRKDDEKVGKLPYCCRNGTLLPVLMDEKKARSIFQLQVSKVPPDLNRTALFPPRNWAIEGVLNPDYKCGAPIRVDPTEFPDPSGLQAVTLAIASWQVTCNITRPTTKKRSKCCVSFSAFYNDSVVPCDTCACGCGPEETGPVCDRDAQALLLPAEALLVPFANRSEKARAWARLKHMRVPTRLPCPDNCGVTINWHVNADYRKGWTARITLFNWMEEAFEDWFSAIQMGRAYDGYENVYSFNGTRLPELDGTVFFRGLPGLNYLMGETNRTGSSRGVRVPGKQQSVMSFSKKRTPGINVQRGDGFPTKVYFNGEECDLPKHYPTKSSGHRSARPTLLFPLLFVVVVYIIVVVRGLN